MSKPAYRDQHKPWQRGEIVVVPTPHDLSTVNAMSLRAHTSGTLDANLALAAFQVNRLLATLSAGGTL